MTDPVKMPALETMSDPNTRVSMVPVRATIDWPALLEQRPAILKHTALQDRAYLFWSTNSEQFP
jgi:hypothetical protein